MQNLNHDHEMDIYRLIHALLKKIWIILLATFIGGLGGFAISAFLMTPRYTATALMYVNNNSFSVGNTSISLSDLNAAQSLVSTYSVILESRNTLEDVIETNHLPYTYEELVQMIQVAPVDNTEVFEIQITDTNPKQAEQIANSIAEILPDKISDIVEGSSAKIVDWAVVPAAKSAPSITRYTAYGAMLGFLISCAVLILREQRNDQIRSKDDLASNYKDIPVLAVIPNLNTKIKKGSYYSSTLESRNQGKK